MYTVNSVSSREREMEEEEEEELWLNEGLSKDTVNTLRELNPRPKEIFPEIYNVHFELPLCELTAALDPETPGPYDPMDDLRKTPYYPKPKIQKPINVEFRAKRNVGKVLLNVERTSETDDGRILQRKVAPATFLRNLKQLDSRKKRDDLIENLTMSQKLIHQIDSVNKIETVRKWHVDLSKSKEEKLEGDEKRYRTLPVDLRFSTLSSTFIKKTSNREEQKEIASLARADYTHIKTNTFEKRNDLLPVRTIVRRAWDYVKATLGRNNNNNKSRKRKEKVHDWAVGLNAETRKHVTTAAVRLLQKEIQTKNIKSDRAQQYRIELLTTLRADHIAADEIMSSPKKRVHEIQWKSLKSLANQRMENVLGSGLWNDPVASTLTKPLDSRVLAPTWSRGIIKESMLVPEASRAVRTIQNMAKLWHRRRSRAAGNLQRSLRGFFVRLAQLRNRREARDISERDRRRRLDRETRERRERHAATRIQSACRSRWERDDTRSGKKMSHLRYERALRLLRRRLVTRLNRRRAVRTLIRWWRYRIRVLRFASAVSIQYVFFLSMV